MGAENTEPSNGERTNLLDVENGNSDQDLYLYQVGFIPLSGRYAARPRYAARYAAGNPMIIISPTCILY